MSSTFETEGPSRTDAAGTRPSFLGIVSGAGLLTAARTASDLASAVLFIVVSRAFGVEGTGLYAYAFAIAGIAQLAVNFGLDDYGLREYACRPAARRPALLANALALQLGFTVLAVPALWLALALSGADARTATLVWMLSAYQIALNFAVMLFIPALHAQRMLWPALAEVAFRAGGALLAVAAIVLLPVDLTGALAVLPALALCLLVAAVFVARAHNGPLALLAHVRFAAAREILPAASTFAASGLVMGLTARLGLILVTAVHGEASTGLYSTGLKLLDFGMAPLLFLGIAAYPRLAASWDTDRDDLGRIARAFVALSFVLGAGVLWGMVFVLPPLLPLLLGADFAAAGPLVRLTGGVALLTALDLAAFRLLWAVHRQDARLRIQLVALAVLAALLAGLVPPFGAAGAIVASAAALGAALVLQARIIVAETPPGTWDGLAKALLGPLALAAGVGLAVLDFAGSRDYWLLMLLPPVAFLATLRPGVLFRS